MSNVNNMDMNYNARNAMNTGRNNEEQQYETSTIDITNSGLGQSYIMNEGGVNMNNIYQNEYFIDKGKYNMDAISQMKMEQTMNSYNNVASMHNATLQEHNESMNMHEMNASMAPVGYENYRNLMNYNTQNAIKTNHMAMHMEDLNNREPMYYNEQTGEMYPEEFLKNLPTTTDPPTVTGYGGNFKMPSGNFNSMMQENYNSMQYPMPVFENMSNPQMYMQQQASLTPKQTRNVPLTNSQQHIPSHMMPNMTPSMQPQIAPTTSLRKIAATNKKKIKPKKFFPCC